MKRGPIERRASELRKLSRQLDELWRLTLTDGYCPALLGLLGTLSVGHATTTINLSLRSAFRARKLDRSFIPKNISDLWHPPAHLVSEFGRANLPHQPVLYCSDGELTSIREVSAQIGDRIAVLELVPRDERRPHIFILGELVARHHSKKSFLGREIDHVIGLIRSMKIDLEKALLIDGFYAKTFRTSGSDLYPLTTAIAQNFMETATIDGIAFPSVASAPIGANLALKPESARRLLRPARVKVIRLEGTIRQTFNARIEALSRSVAADGTIAWE